jgi:hypothetical protein
MSLIISTIYAVTHAMLVNENKDNLKIDIGFYSCYKPIKTDFKNAFCNINDENQKSCE